MVEALYGVRHFVATTNFFGDKFESYIYPSDGLLKELSDLPKGKVIGIDHSQDYSLIIGKTGDKYWDKIVSQCELSSLEIVYLENMEIWKKYNDELSKINKVNGEIAFYEYFENNSNNLRRLYATKRALQTSTRYIHEIEREDAMFRNISNFKPNIVIMGLGHTNYLYQNKKVQEEYGIEIGKYKIEDIIENNHDGCEESNSPTIIRTCLNDNPVVDEQLLLDRELLIRGYKAVKKKYLV